MTSNGLLSAAATITAQDLLRLSHQFPIGMENLLNLPHLTDLIETGIDWNKESSADILDEKGMVLNYQINFLSKLLSNVPQQQESGYPLGFANAAIVSI